MIIYKNEDIIKPFVNGEFDVLVHGCNCFCTMGAGLAYAVAKTFPNVYEEDKKTTYGDINKMGTIVPVKVMTNSYVVNAYTQHACGVFEKEVMARYDAIKKCLQLVCDKFPTERIAIHKIGCGLAGGDWGVVEKIVQDVFGKRDVLVFYI